MTAAHSPRPTGQPSVTRQTWQVPGGALALTADMPDSTHDRHILGQALRELRGRSGLTQKELAERAGTNEAYISHAETGRLDVRWHTLRRLLRGLGANMRQFGDAIDRADGED
jgi:DNA-binding XRE family transcriptional regulator